MQSETSYPVLGQLDRELRQLYHEVQRGVVRVQLPAPRWLVAEADKNNPLDDPAVAPLLSKEVKEKLEEQRKALREGKVQQYTAVITPTSSPADGAAAGATTMPAGLSPWRMSTSGDGTMVLEPRGGNTAIEIHSGGERNITGEMAPGGRLMMNFAQAGDFAPNNVGLLLDDEGHFLVPIYVEKETVGEKGIKVAIGDQQATARFVGSDKPTNVTLLKIEKPAGQATALGHPVVLSQILPPVGSLVLLLSPNSGDARPIVWTGNVQAAGIIANVDGTVAGFVRYGQFFSAHACEPVLEQLKTNHEVKRATLGMRLAPVRPDDADRRQNALLAQNPALRITDVSANSIAAKAGLHAGDLIFRIGEEPVGDMATFAAFLSARTGVTPLQILRGRENTVVMLELPEQLK